MISHRPPAVVIHSLADARAALAIGRPVTLLSAPGAALYAGCGWWRALVTRASAKHGGVPMEDILDCADASGLALGALHTGQRRLVLTPNAPGWSSIAAIAAALGGDIFTSRPSALDMAEHGAIRRLRDWLQVRSSPDDNGHAVS